VTVDHMQSAAIIISGIAIVLNGINALLLIRLFNKFK